MSNIPDPQSRPPVQWSDADDRAMDALLQEYFRISHSPNTGSNSEGGSGSSVGPRDFTTAILAKLDESRGVQDSSGANRITRSSLAGARKIGRVALAIRVIAALAASVLAVLVIRDWNNSTDQFDIADNAGQRVDTKASALGGTLPNQSGNVPASGQLSSPTEIASIDDGSIKSQTLSKPRREPIVLSLDKPLAGPENESAGHGGAAVVGEHEGLVPSAPDSLVASQNASLKDFDRQFITYWKSIGIEPAPAVDETTLANRIAERFGFHPGSSENGGAGERNGQIIPELSSENLFSTGQQSRLLAERLVKQLAVGLDLNDERKEQLVASATDVIRSGGRFDQWISDWVASETLADETPGTPTSKAATMVDWVAGRVVGADVGCARCHDSPIDSRFNQHDYWSVAALFAPVQTESLFYEMPDGRQKVVSPGAPRRWIELHGQTGRHHTEDTSRIGSREQFAQALIGNRQLARSLVNHLWTIGFGTPMVSAASSPIAPPRDDSIEVALEMLSEKLVASNFDIRIAARWIVQSEPMKRAAPIELQGDSWQIAGESQLVSASLAQRSFAAARSPWPSASRAQLLAMMESRSGKQPSKIGPQDSMLAQPTPSSSGADSIKTSSSSRGDNRVNHQDYWWTQWLADREGLRGGWMESITDPGQQLRHAFYAAGYRNVSERQIQWASSLLGPSSANPNDRREEVAKVYWIIQNAP